jgi:hypothetical protein
MKCIVKMFIALQEDAQLVTNHRVRILFDSPRLAEDWLTKNSFKKYKSLAKTDLWESTKSGYIVGSLHISRSEGEAIRARVEIDERFVGPEDIQFT